MYTAFSSRLLLPLILLLLPLCAPAAPLAGGALPVSACPTAAQDKADQAQGEEGGDEEPDCE